MGQTEPFVVGVGAGGLAEHRTGAGEQQERLTRCDRDRPGAGRL
jgi:hypothetical protein